MTTSLSGTRPGHALFTSVGRAVVIDLVTLTASATFPEYEVIPDQWNETPDPVTVPTQAFTVADEALSDVVVINASGKRSGKRTYAVPKNVRDIAKRALTAGGGTVIEQSVATHLSSGKPVSYDTVRHVNMYFEYADLTGIAAAGRDLWGGDAGAHWAEKIILKEVALRAAAEAPHDLGLSARGAMNPRPATGTIEDDPGPEQPWGSVDPTEAHVFSPLSIVNPWDCEYCFGSERAPVHTNDMRTQVVANYGEGSDELAQYDAYLATFDDPSPESVISVPMGASGLLRETAPEPVSLIASAFFTDDYPSDDCDYHAEYDGDGDGLGDNDSDGDGPTISGIYVSRADGTWGQWNPATTSWDDAGDASDANLQPIDPNSAYVVAMQQAQGDGSSVPVRDIHTGEWAAADAAQNDVADEVDSFEETEPEFFIQTAEDDATQVQDLYAHRAGLWFGWDGQDWIASPEPTNVSQVDEDDAEQIARWLTWADNQEDPGDEPVTAAIPKVGKRAPRADQPGYVPRTSSRYGTSRRSPYASRGVNKGDSNWFRKAGSASPTYAPGQYGPSAGAPAAPGAAGYTPQERSQNATKQVRDGYGRFATGGSTIDTQMGTGTITKIDPAQQKIEVKLADGSTQWVDAKQTRVHGANESATPTPPPNGTGHPKRVTPGELPPGMPRATASTPKAQLPKLLPIMDSKALNAMLDNASAYFAQERARAAKINKGVTASANNDGVMVAFFLDPDLAQQFAVPGGEPADALHMTLAYLGDQSEAPDAQALQDCVQQWAAQTPPITGEISGHGVFTNGDQPVTHMSVDCPDLPAARQSLIEHLQANGFSPRMNHGFDPHITLAYNDTPVDVPPTPVTFSHVTVSHGENDIPIPMGGNAAMAAAAPAAGLTPDTSDVEPIHLAIVDPVDKSAVMDLLDLVPASATSTEPVLFKRTDKGWERDDNTLMSMRGATPPLVVTLDAQTFPSVLQQVDASLAKPADAAPVAASAEIDLYNEFGELFPALTAVAGQEVTPKDALAAERLRKYWTFGPGGAKIRWGQGGDFNRCVRHLSKYLGPRAKGYCQLRHHDVLGFYTGTHAKMLHGGKKHGVAASGFEIPDEQIQVELAAAWDRATALVAAGAPDQQGGGARFRIPVVVPEGVPTGDGRIFKPLALTTRDLPIPLLWQLKTADGHDGSVIIGRIDSIERIANGLGNAYGVFDTNPHATEAERLVREGFLRGVSADLDNFEAESEKPDDSEAQGKDTEKIAPDTTTISKARVMAVTAVPKPAFQECTIELIEDDPEQEAPVITDGVYAERDDETLVACALVASQIPVVPPADWFTNPGLTEATPLTTTDDGRVFGHIAAWHVDHIGMPFGTKPPKSRSGYRYFHTGVVRTDDGKDVPVGQLTLAGGHASLELTADAAVRHYDDTHSAVADVHAGEDQFGIWVAGALRPDVDAARIRSLRASAPSGDWRPIGGRLELVAVCQVNVPGFPVARARVASGYVTALVAAGAAPLAQLKGLSVEDRVKKLEGEALQAKMDAARERMAPALSAHAETLAARAGAARDRMNAMLAASTDLADYSPETRMEYARKGWAMPDGGYPISNGADLKNAIRAYGRAGSGQKAKVRRHIMKRARGLGRADLIPSAWTSASIEERWQDARATFAELAAMSASADVAAPLEDVVVQRDQAVARFAALRAAVTSPAKPDAEHPALPTDGNVADAPVVDKAPAPLPFDPSKHPRLDNNGQFRAVLARLHDNVTGQPGADAIRAQIDHTLKLMDSAQLNELEQATGDLMKTINDVADKTTNASVQENMRNGFKALGTELAKLPMPQGSETAKMRWSDLPPQLQNMVEGVMGKLQQHLKPEAYGKVTSEVNDFKTGVHFATSDQIQSWLSNMTQYLLD